MNACKNASHEYLDGDIFDKNTINQFAVGKLLIIPFDIETTITTSTLTILTAFSSSNNKPKQYP